MSYFAFQPEFSRITPETEAVQCKDQIKYLKLTITWIINNLEFNVFCTKDLQYT